MKKIVLFITLITFTITQAQIVNIPDANFKDYLLYHHVIDTNNDNEIQIYEALAYTGALNFEPMGDIYATGIYDFTGIETFVNITSFTSFGSSVINLNLSGLTALTQIIYTESSDVFLNSLNLTGCISLTSLNCSGNVLTNLDLSTNLDLTSLNCGGNQLSNLDISSNTSLTSLNCGGNQLSNLDISSNTSLTSLNSYSNQLTNLNVSANTSLTYLNCGSNQLTNLDVSANTSLTYLECHYNLLTNLDVSENTSLTYLNFTSNQLSNLDVFTNIFLIHLRCSTNQLSNLDVSSNSSLTKLSCSNNPNLTYINLKNGNNEIFNPNFYNFNFLPNLQTVCVDELNTALTAFIVEQTGHSVTFTEYCSFNPAQSNNINGTVNIDINNNGCDANDISLNNVLIISDNGTESFGTFVLEDANYSMFTNEGYFTTEVTTNLPSYFTVNPSSQTNTFTGFDNTFTADFCITPNQTINDVNITLVPTSQARPGFNTTYQIVYKNVGTTQLNGNVTLEFDETKLNFLNASETVNTQTTNSLIFNYSNLNPFETRTIDLEFNVFAPPTVNIDDILNFTATINPIAGDFTTDDNIFTLSQTVIGSYDPNDITCLEGNQILLADANKYLHYIIRFQNTGTASAINVVVKNILDTNLDWSTLQLESLSHNNRVAIKNGNEIEFIFENINLPDSTTDEPNSHGFIAYKIKPKADITLGDIIPNKAEIFFDFNEAVETNIATTTIVNALAVNENTLLDFSVYPIPTQNILNIKSKTEITKIEIYSKLGQLIIKNTTENKIDISNLTQGLYFVKVEDVNGNFSVKKIVKK